MKAAVKSVLDDIRIKTEKNLKAEIDQKDVGKLKELCDMDILTDAELEKAIESYKYARTKKDNNERYLEYSKILDELKEIKYLDQDQYAEKNNLLKRHFNMD